MTKHILTTFLKVYSEQDVSLPMHPYAPIDMPDKAWSNWGELRTYKDCTDEVLGNPDLGQINVTIPDSKTLELRCLYFHQTSQLTTNNNSYKKYSSVTYNDPEISPFFSFFTLSFRRAYYASVSHVDDEIGRYNDKSTKVTIKLSLQGAEHVGRSWTGRIDNSCILGRSRLAAWRARRVGQTHKL